MPLDTSQQDLTLLYVPVLVVVILLNHRIGQTFQHAVTPAIVVRRQRTG